MFYTVRDLTSGEYLCWSPETQMFFFSTSRAVIKDSSEMINFYLQCATEGYPEVIGERQLEIVEVSFNQVLRV